MNCRLKQNVIVGGKFMARDTIVNDAILPERLKTDLIIAYDLDDRQGKVLVLHDLAFQSIPKPGADGVPVSYPTHVTAGELLDLSQVPASHRESLKEGTDYKSQWTDEERLQLMKAEEDAYLKQFETESPVTPRAAVLR